MGESVKVLGSYLREARELRGLSLEEIAQETKINKIFLEALEKEDWDVLPAEIYVRGYLRAYAEAVGLDPKEVLLRYEALERPQKGPLFERRITVSKRTFPWFGALLILTVLLALVAYLIFSGS